MCFEHFSECNINFALIIVFVFDEGYITDIRLKTLHYIQRKMFNWLMVNSD